MCKRERGREEETERDIAGDRIENNVGLASNAMQPVDWAFRFVP